MAKTRKAVSRFVGEIQCVVGGSASVFAYLIYASQSIRDALAVTFEEVYLYMFLLLVFGMFSILSGLLFIRKEESRS